MKLYSEYLREKFNLPSEWQACIWNSHDVPEGYVKIKGGVPVGKTKKGRTKWAAMAKLDTHFVADADFDTWLLEWEKRTGICSRCEGRGEVARIDFVNNITTRRKCSRCGAEPGEATK